MSSLPKDFVGKDLSIGDTVVFMDTFNNSVRLKTGKIVEFTPQMIYIEYGIGMDHVLRVKRAPYNVVRVEV